MIHDDNRSRTVELTHHTVAWREPEHIVGDLENDARTFKADVVVRRVSERDQDVTEIHTAAAQSQTNLTGLQRALGFGPRAQSNVPRVQRAVAEGGKPPGSRLDKFSALESLGAHQPRGEARAVTERELRFVTAGRFGDPNIGAGPVVDIGQHDAPRILGLCAPQQSPHSRLGEIGDVFG
jgi:hypothetical protein